MVQNPPGLAVAETLRRYKSNPNVLYAEPDYEVTTTAIPTDPLWSQQWDMVKIQAPDAWNILTGASDVIVAIIDTGINFSHPDLQGNLWTNPSNGSHGFTCLNGTCVAGGQDDQGHGTHVAGTIGAAAGNGTGIAGINWDARMMACKFLDANGSGSVSDAILCFNQIVSLKQQGFNIRVTNNSWGFGGFSQALKDAMAAAEAAGILHVCAAGNGNLNADVTPIYPGGYDNRGIVSVLASDQNDLAAYFTYYGMANVDIAAPGLGTLSTVPTGTCYLCDPSGYRLLSGTSMAAPHVAGAIAALFHLNPALTVNQARDVLLHPSSYDPVTDPKGAWTSTGGRLNLLKAFTSPLLTAPVLNNFPAIAGISNDSANAGGTINLTATASDPDGDPLRKAWARGRFNAAPGATSLWLMGWTLNTILPNPTGDPVSFQAPALARTVVAPYAVSVADGRGGGAISQAYATILPASSAGLPPSGSLTVSPTQAPVDTTLSVNFPATDPEGGPVAWDLWQTGSGEAVGFCCQTGSSFDLPMNFAGAFRISVQAMDRELNVSNRQSVVVRIGGATGTPPIANAVFDKLTGPAPLSVNINMSSSTDPDGSIQQYIIECKHGSNGNFVDGPSGSCVFDTPGNYWIMLQVRDNDNLMDTMSVYAVVTPPGSTANKSPASVVLGSLSQTFTGSVLTPTATTNPPGLAITWTNASHTDAGSYPVTATVDDQNYEGSGSGIFTINRAMASVGLSNLTQTYTGNQLTPAASTTPPGLSIAWTNAPQATPGSYQAVATVNDQNYQGLANGTFTINKAQASVVLDNLTQTNTGSALTPSATTTPPGLAITWTNAPQTQAGTYAVTATVNDLNYQGSASGTFTITNGAPATVVLGNMTQAYTGNALTPSATTTPPGLAITWTNAPRTQAGSYAVTATVNDAGYQGSASGTFTITKAAATVVLSNMTRTYTGSALTPSAATTPSGLAITWTNAPQTQAGTYAVTATVNDANYQGSASGTFTITNGAASVVLSNMTRTYTGSALTPSATTTPPGLAITWTNAPRTQTGSYAVTATVNDANYQGSASGTFTITKGAASVVLSNMTRTYTGSALTPSATTTPPGLAITWTNAPKTQAGTYAVTATVNDANYQGSASGTFTITKGAASVVLSNMTQTYTGSALTPLATTTPPGLAITWTNAPQTNAGSYAVTATVNSANYQGSASGTFTINPAPASSTPPGVSITSPVSGTVRTGPITIQAVATQGTNPIARVDFLINGNIKCSDAAAPYACAWNMPGAAGRNYQLQAKAYDTTGQVGVSSIVTLTSSR
ncbi:MAG: S8 family serine peptidase [Acidobacteriia bacterium]|nr:S8 family serine peptidase [Terriglobia bacterium]